MITRPRAAGVVDVVDGVDLMIADAVRSPLGPCRGDLTMAGIRPGVLLAQTAWALLERSRLEPAAVTKVLVAGGPCFERIGRDASALLGIAPTAVGTTSARRSVVHEAARSIGRRDVVLALGASGADPHAYAMSADQVLGAELVATRWRIGREEMDAYARRSRERAGEVALVGEFAAEIVPAVAWSRHSRVVVTADQTIGVDASPRSLARHPYVGRHLAPGHVSPPAVGAASAILVGSDRAAELGLRPRARVLAVAESHDSPSGEHCGQIRASRGLLERTGTDPDDLDHYEVSEAFSSVPLAWCREFDADPDRFNPRGGSIALGRPGPAADLRSLTTMLSALEATGGRSGLLASEGPGDTGEALLVEYLTRTCCSREVLGYRPTSGALLPPRTAG